MKLSKEALVKIPDVQGEFYDIKILLADDVLIMNKNSQLIENLITEANKVNEKAKSYYPSFEILIHTFSKDPLDLEKESNDDYIYLYITIQDNLPEYVDRLEMQDFSKAVADCIKENNSISYDDRKFSLGFRSNTFVVDSNERFVYFPPNPYGTEYLACSVLVITVNGNLYIEDNSIGNIKDYTLERDAFYSRDAIEALKAKQKENAK